MNDIKKYKVKISIKNNILYTLIMQDSKSIKEFSEKHKLCLQSVHRLLAFKGMKKKNLEYTDTAKKIAYALNVIPEVLFPEEFMFVQKNTISISSNIRYLEQLQCTNRIEYLNDLKDKDENNDLKEILKNALKTIPHIEQKIINLYYGLNGEEEHSLREIGGFLNITAERVNQIRKKGLRRIEYRLKKLNIKEHLNGTVLKANPPGE